MDIITLAQTFLISLAIGSLIGLEREHSHTGKERFGGLRTFIFISLFGTLSAMLAEIYTYLILITAFLGIILIICFSYIATVYLERNVGIVNETASLITFILGVMCYMKEFQQFAIILAILVTTLLATKRITHEFAHKLKDVEVLDTLKFAVIALVVLPLLSPYNSEINLYGPLTLNPYEIWLMVVFIAGISFVGYILMKFFGAEKGIGITGIIGGLFSSTAVTTTMAGKIRENNLLLKACVFATIISSAVMFMRILVVVAIINNTLLPYVLVPLLAMAITGGLLAFMVWRKRARIKTETAEIELKSPFSIIPALKFGIFFATVLLVAKAANIYFGETGIYAASIFSGLADVDAITLSMATMSGKGLIETGTAVTAITLAAMSNTIVKFAIAYLFGTHEFGKWIGVIFGAMILVGAAVLLIL